MPLSKERDRERARERRRLAKLPSNLMPNAVQPKTDALQSKSSPIKEVLNTTAPTGVQPTLPFYTGAGPHFGEVLKKECGSLMNCLRIRLERGIVIPFSGVPGWFVREYNNEVIYAMTLR